MKIELHLATAVENTARLSQLIGVFDLQASYTTDIIIDAPVESRDWSVGLIEGPSGSGKSRVAEAMFGRQPEHEWPANKAIVDSIGGGIREITAALSSVGFSSPPNWTRPYRVLSNGEKFRADLARSLMSDKDLVVCDEFTSMVDRDVAKSASVAVSRAFREKKKRFVAVACHADVEEWLDPDWVIRPHLGTFEWRLLRRRPIIEARIVRVDHQAWSWFSAHHYLSSDLHRSAKCFAMMVGEKPVCFAAVLPRPHPVRKNWYGVSRIVVLPEWQGLGIAKRMLAFLGGASSSAGKTLTIGTAHPALTGALRKDPGWVMIRKLGFTSKTGKTSSRPSAQTDRRSASFEWVGGKGEGVELWQS